MRQPLEPALGVHRPIEPEPTHGDRVVTKTRENLSSSGKLQTVVNVGSGNYVSVIIEERFFRVVHCDDSVWIESWNALAGDIEPPRGSSNIQFVGFP